MPAGMLDDRAKQLARLRHREAINRALAIYPVDVVHLHGLDFIDYIPSANVPVVVTLHLPLGWYPKEALSPRAQTYLVCVSNSQAAACPHQAGVHCVIENGVRVTSQPRARRVNNRPYVLSIGRICPEKGFHLAMDAATACEKRFLLAGNVYEYPSHRKYFEQEIKPRLSKNHYLLGTVGLARKRQLLADATCLLVPSLVAETSSLVAMEAMACGTPVIAFPSGALRELIHHGHTGFLVNSAEEMARAIPTVVAIDPNRCRAEAEFRFSAHRMIDRYLDLYRHAAANRMLQQIEVAT
jgi:glycosyltransferase involved in cell wall biosynthesis